MTAPHAKDADDGVYDLLRWQFLRAIIMPRHSLLERRARPVRGRH